MAIDKSKSFIMAQRLKELRNEKGLSHESLRKALIEKYEIDISSDSLKNYEVSKAPHAKAYKNDGMRVEYLRCLSDFYGVSSDYILGVTAIKSGDPDVQSVINITGLSEDSISTLQNPSNIPNEEMIPYFHNFVDLAISFANNYSLMCDYYELSDNSDLDHLVDSIDSSIAQLKEIVGTEDAIQALNEFSEIILWNRNRNLTPRFYAKAIADSFEKYLLQRSLYDFE